jgi:hypothetical protein
MLKRWQFMKTGIKRKKSLSGFTIRECGINAVLMSILFRFGLYLSWQLSSFAGMLYVFFYHTGCPNCLNTKCPMNPDFES